MRSQSAVMFAMICASAAGQPRSGAALVAMPGGFRPGRLPPRARSISDQRNTAQVWGPPRVGLERRTCVRAGSLRLARFPAPGRRRGRPTGFSCCSLSPVRQWILQSGRLSASAHQRGGDASGAISSFGRAFADDPGANQIGLWRKFVCGRSITDHEGSEPKDDKATPSERVGPSTPPVILDEYPPLIVLKKGGVYSVTRYWVKVKTPYFVTLNGDTVCPSRSRRTRVPP